MARKVKAKALKKPKEKSSKKKIINTICILFLSLVLIGSVTTFAVVQAVLSSENLQGIDGLDSENSTQIYDRNGELITTLSSKSGVRENIKYKQIPQVVVDAFLSIEDSRFYKHNGFDFPRFMKSGYENLKAGGIAQGGSTLTMQLVDTSLWSDEEKETFGMKEKFQQKIQEIFKSMEIESKLSKEKIIENYLNKINFGGPARGIQKGAKYYFGKDVSDLTLSESAFLAGVINAPGAYNPYLGVETFDTTSIDHYKKATERRNQVLDMMVLHGYISKTESNLAKSETLAFLLNGVTNFETEKYKSFVDAAVREVRKKTGEDPYTTPMKIYTTMDKAAQEKADALCDGEGIDWPDEMFQTGFAATNTQTGEVMALGGGRGYNGQKDRATLDTHQIGSTAKPIVDYAPAFEYLGYSTEHTLLDAPVAYTGDGSTLYNADRKFRGDVTLKQAIGTSLNIPAYKTMKDVVDKIGVKKWISLLSDMGIDVSEESFAYSMSIGGADLVATPLQMAGSFAVFSNKGNYIEPYTVKKVEFQKDKKDYKASSESQNVYSEETAFLMSYMLKDAVDNSSYQTLVNTLQSSYPVYGKSGTTDYDEPTAARYNVPVGASRDKWMVGYTSEYSVACWAGYDDPGPNNWLDDNKLWANIEGTVVKSMLDTLETGKTVSAITQPSGVVSISFVKGLFPYAGANDSVDPSMMVTGLINKKFAKLGNSVSPDELSALSALDISLQGNSLNINFAAYPDASKLQRSNGTITVSVGGVSSSVPIFFDKSLLFGAVEYKYQIYVNGNPYKTGSSSSNSINETVNVANGDKVYVVGWYGYQNASVKSNSVTSDIVSTRTVTFETNGGNAIPPIVVNDGETISLPQPIKDGANFGGWYSDADLATPFTTGTKVTANLTLYAKWV